MFLVTCEFVSASCARVSVWQKELHEAPLEVKEKYFFVVSTVISTVLFYLLFLCLDVTLTSTVSAQSVIAEYSFSISYCVSYLTSVVWQHFLNQYFVFALGKQSHSNHQIDEDAFCDSLFRTYLVYG